MWLLHLASNVISAQKRPANPHGHPWLLTQTVPLFHSRAFARYTSIPAFSALAGDFAHQLTSFGEWFSSGSASRESACSSRAPPLSCRIPAGVHGLAFCPFYGKSVKTDTCRAYAQVRSRGFIHFSPSDQAESRASPLSDSSLVLIVSAYCT